ncbi:hypothetical protein TNCV_3466631 [Trichonephila clavipes]|nr:hypothetical protein TNCV_3466631 [Trichonephila clavipes]
MLICCRAEDNSRHSARTEVAYDEWIPSNDVLKKYVASAICSSVDDELFEHIKTSKFSAFRDDEGFPTLLFEHAQRAPRGGD